MEYLKQKVFSLTVRFSKRGEPPVENSRKEVYLNFAYKVLMWENPWLTLMTLLFCIFMSCVILLLEVRFYCVLFSSLLALFVFDTYIELLGVKEARTQSSDKFRRKVCKFLVDLVLHLILLRRAGRLAFLMTSSTLFLMIAYIGLNVPGCLIFYLFLLAIFLVPLAVLMTPDRHLQSFRDCLLVLNRNEDIFSELELIPHVTNDDVNEKDVDLDSLTDKTGDSITNSLISGITSMPSHLDVDGDEDILEEEDLQPSVTPSQASLLSRIPAVEYSSDSDEASSEHKDMEFKSLHFNPDSSSEEESNYTKGLDFTDAKDSVQDGHASGVSSFGGILSNLGNIGSTLVSNVIKSKEPAKKQDSDSEFEIINDDELDEQ